MRVLQSLLFCLTLLPAAQAAEFVIQNVTVVDVVTGAEHPHESILIRNGHIADVGPRVRSSPRAAFINGTGKYAIPGLWDMHVHLWYRDNQFPLFLANGVTGVRDMGSDLAWVNQWRTQMKAGKLLGPRIITSGPAVDGAPSEDEKLPVYVVRNPRDARDTFDRLDNLEVDFIKVLSGVPRDAYFALIERARKYWIPVAGHVPPSVRLAEAVEARQRSVEHLSGLLLACSKNESHLRKKLLEAIAARDPNLINEIQAQVLDSFDPKRADELFPRMTIYDVRQVPTLIMLRRSFYADAEELAKSPDLRYVSPAIRKGWPNPVAERDQTPESRRILAAAQYDKLRQLIPVMAKARVPIMAGTDTGDPYTFPGFDLHTELELLSGAGLGPLGALRAATLEPARYLEAAETLGRIQPNYEADLVLLDADPLADIRNTRKIYAVILQGQYLPKARLNAMLAPVSAGAAHSAKGR